MSYKTIFPNLPGEPKKLEPVERALLSEVYGVHVIGSRSADGAYNLMLADWVMQVSFRPRLVAVSLENDARTLRFVRETGLFTVNLLHEKDGEEIARKVVMPAEAAKVRGRSPEEAAKVINKLERVPHAFTERGVPIVTQALAWYECQAEQFVPVGDHTLVIGRVLDGDVLRTGEMLTEKELGWEYAG
jgi:flavin reductase (DIM6/NTAB) family NADH-FMN oxidoreductase RutF